MWTAARLGGLTTQTVLPTIFPLPLQCTVQPASVMPLRVNRLAPAAWEDFIPWTMFPQALLSFYSRLHNFRLLFITTANRYLITLRTKQPVSPWEKLPQQRSTGKSCNFFLSFFSKKNTVYKKLRQGRGKFNVRMGMPSGWLSHCWIIRHCVSVLKIKNLCYDY